jgi:hypothetical protein
MLSNREYIQGFGCPISPRFWEKWGLSAGYAHNLRSEAPELVRQRNSEALADSLDVPIIVLVELVARVEFHQPRGANTTHRLTIDDAFSCQMFAPVLHAVYIVALFIQFVRVDIEFVPTPVDEYEVALPTVGTISLPVPSAAQNLPELRHIPVRYRNIQVIVDAGLMTQEGVDGPTTIHIHLDAVML